MAIVLLQCIIYILIKSCASSERVFTGLLENKSQKLQEYANLCIRLQLRETL